MGKIIRTTESEEKKQGILYIVSTPIGNDEDISFRAIKVLKSCDLVICEEPKPAFQLLKRNNLTCDIIELNEQNEDSKTQEIIGLLEEGKKLALISDCGTPVFADPGYQLVKTAIHRNYHIEVVPGASSLMAAIVRSGFSINTFLYAGFLSRDSEDRIWQLKHLRDEKRTVVLLEAPYRILQVLEACSKLMPNRRAYIGCNLTMHFETNHYGTFSELFEKFKELKFKGEFVIVFEGNYFNERREREFKPKSGFRGDRGRRDSRDRASRDRSPRDRDSRGKGTRERSFKDRDSRGGRDSGDRDSRRRRDSGVRDSRGGRDSREKYSKGKSSRGKDFSAGRKTRD
ncbi:MAG: 16S rRNA (cytidine(1402)-2'-O)-methyltransferase [Bacteroidetes bacterium]|nr:MAG: 16S rRNA (cytidine(1402)-2'-O)-methyltransferase [Bacteroidota bacterium]